MSQSATAAEPGAAVGDSTGELNALLMGEASGLAAAPADASRASPIDVDNDDECDMSAKDEHELAQRELTCLNCDARIPISEVLAHTSACRAVSARPAKLSEIPSPGTIQWKDTSRSLLKSVPLRAWRRVLCVIDADKIELFKAIGEPPLATIAVSVITKVAICSVKGREFCFRVRTRDEGVFHTFDAETDESMHQWLMQFAYVCENGTVLRYKPVASVKSPSAGAAASGAAFPDADRNAAAATAGGEAAAGASAAALADQAVLPNVAASGFLEKKGEGTMNMMLNRWQTREFTLTRDLLVWAADGVERGRLIIDETFTIEMGREARGFFEFHILVPGGRKYFLRAADAETRQAWIDSLLAARRHAPQFRAAAAVAAAAAATTVLAAAPAAAGAASDPTTPLAATAVEGASVCLPADADAAADAAAAPAPVAIAEAPAPVAAADAPAAVTDAPVEVADAPTEVADARAAAAVADSPPVAGAPVAGAPVAGAPVAGAPVAGAPVAGAPVAGAPVAGAPVAGAAAPE